MQAVTEPRVVGRYALYDELASGGMGAVHLAAMRAPEGPVVVAAKRLHGASSVDPRGVAILFDELRVTRCVQHANVVRAVDLVYDGEQMVLVMEYVHGQSFRRLLSAAARRGERVPRAIAAAVARDVLLGLGAAHEASSPEGAPLGLVHRDVTPENILIGSDGTIRLADFGVAKAAGRIQATHEGRIKGKLPYLAPEQVGGEVSPRTDLYAVGLVVWEALVGRRAIEGADDAELLGRVIRPCIPPPSTLVDGLPPELDAVLARALDADPEARFASAEELVRALEAAVGPGGFASPEEVAAWVRHLAGDALEQREQRIDAILRREREAAFSGSFAAVVEERARSGGAGRIVPWAGVAAAIATVALLGVGSIGLLVARAHAAAPGEAPPTVSVSVPTSAAGALAAAPAPGPASAPDAPIAAGAPAAEAATVAVAVASDPGEPGPDRVRRATPRTGRSPHAARVSAACDPPYTVDARGIRSYKDDCFR